ncbi:Nuclear pore glycoprotein p62 [Fasciola hepatica]|uniref:Nuclear pore glycoprotein p62 n=1 Tax=Fasciola hepatica TaxID=6192 RepID=A0A4E0RKP2_FASHE|nr:Nuclear pore glycoprotein p62 [Fasciola hepatica]
MSAGGFSFGTPTTTTGTGFSFGFPTAGANPAQTGASTNLFSPATTALGQPSFGLGLQTPKTTALSLFGQTTSTATTTSTPGISAPVSFGFGLKTPTTSVAAVTGSSVSTPGFGFGLSTAKPGSTPSSGMTPFGMGPTTSASLVASPFSFGTTTQPTTAVIQPSSIGFGVPASTSSVSASLATTAAQSPFTLGTSASTGLKPLGTVPGFSMPANANAQPSQTVAQATTASSVQPPLQFSLKPATTQLSAAGAIQKLTGVPSTTTSASPQIGLGITAPQPSLPSLTFQPLTTTSATLGTIPMPSSTTSTGTGLGLSSSLFKSTTATTTAATPVSAMGFGLQTSTGTPATSVVSTSATSVTAPTTTTAVTQGTAAVSKTATLTYNQLEDLINKWACELDDQERYFLDEADRITQWDQALINNGEKITTLYEKVEGCKSEQLQIEKELDLIENQQKELEDLLEPLERAANELPPGQLHSDFEREAIFQMASNVDLELGQLLSDLREMADQMNSSTTRLGLSGDSSSTESSAKDSGGAKLIKSFSQSGDGLSAVQQLTRILNCHMHSLNWIHHNSQELMERLKLLEAGQAP